MAQRTTEPGRDSTSSPTVSSSSVKVTFTIPCHTTISIWRGWSAVEAGGTKFVCAVGTGPDDIRAELRVATTTPARRSTGGGVLHRASRAHPARRSRHRQLRPRRSRSSLGDVGSITTTPKQGWRHIDLVGPLRRALGIPVSFDTDVNGAALAEHRWGNARDYARWSTSPSAAGSAAVRSSMASRCTGSSIRDGASATAARSRPRSVRRRVSASRATAGRAWPRRRRSPHAGGRIRRRWPTAHPAWDLEADYLALGLANLVLVLSPERIVLGGGVMARAGLCRWCGQARGVLAGYVRVAGARERRRRATW